MPSAHHGGPDSAVKYLWTNVLLNNRTVSRQKPDDHLPSFFFAFFLEKEFVVLFLFFEST